jgi:hypothetical protein
MAATVAARQPNAQMDAFFGGLIGGMAKVFAADWPV